MKKFIVKIVYFIFPLLIISYPLDYGMSYFLSQSNTYPGEFEVWNDIYNHNANCDIAIYGSSRSWVHIDPEILSDSLNTKVYNFGIDGHNFWLQYLRHLEFIKHNEKPKTIILSVDVFTLQKRVELYELNQFLPYMLWNSNIQKYTSSYIGYDKIDYCLPLIRYYGKSNSLNLIKKNIAENQISYKYRKNGFLGMDKIWNDDLDRAKSKNKSYQIKTDPKSILLFEHFIKQCKKTNIELIMVYTPEHIDGQKFIANRDELVNIYKSLASKYSLNFYDYSKNILCKNKDYFYNASHLNKKGASLFSKDFAHKLKERTTIRIHNK